MTSRIKRSPCFLLAALLLFANLLFLTIISLEPKTSIILQLTDIIIRPIRENPAVRLMPVNFNSTLLSESVAFRHPRNIHFTRLFRGNDSEWELSFVQYSSIRSAWKALRSVGLSKRKWFHFYKSLPGSQCYIHKHFYPLQHPTRRPIHGSSQNSTRMHNNLETNL